MRGVLGALKMGLIHVLGTHTVHIDEAWGSRGEYDLGPENFSKVL